MRLDKFLKLSRIIKRRIIAKELADNDRIMINHKLAKAANNIKIGDIITIVYPNKTFNFQVLNIKEIVSKEESSDLYKLL